MSDTFEQFLKENLADYLDDIANHGADAGYPSLTYTQDTVELFDKYADEIWELAVDEAEATGCKNVMEFIAGFNRIDMADSVPTFKNLMVWFAAETYARRYQDEREATGE